MYKIIWYSNYYDGPLSGLVLYEGNELWFECGSWGGPVVTDFFNDEDDQLWQDSWIPRVFKVFKLSRYEMAKRLFSHWVWVTLVKPRATSIVGKYYYKWFALDRQKEDKILNNAKLIGAFSSGEYCY